VSEAQGESRQSSLPGRRRGGAGSDDCHEPRACGLPRLVIAPGLNDSPDLWRPGAAEPEPWFSAEGRIFAYSSMRDGQFWIQWPERATFCFDSQAEEVRALPHSPFPPEWLLDTYYRSVLPLVMQVRGWDVLHASAVRGPRGVIAVCGRSGSGKSTLACGLNQRGYALWADDDVVFGTSPHGVQTAPLPFRLRLRPASAAYFGRSPAGAGPVAGNDSFTPVRLEPVALAAVYVIERAGDSELAAPIEIGRLSPGRALLAVFDHGYCFSLRDMERKRRTMRQYLNLAAEVPVYAVRFQPGWNRLRAVVDGLDQLLQPSC